MRYETRAEFHKELNKLEELKKAKDPTYSEEYYRLYEWMEDYEISKELCYSDKCLRKLRIEPDSRKRQLIMRTERKAG